MTLRKIIEIIVEEVERAVEVSRLNVAALSFGDDSGLLLEAARAVNGEALHARADDAGLLSGCIDALFVDYLPPPVAAEIALGLAFSPAAALVHRLLREGKPVFLLKPSPESGGTSGAYLELYKGYWRSLAAYGVVYLGGKKSSPEAEKTTEKLSAPLTRACVIRAQNAGLKKITVPQGTPVTALAKDAAKEAGICIHLKS